MLQLRRNDPSRRRKIKRDFATVPKKGIAGLRTEDSIDSDVEARLEARLEDIVPVTPTNTPQSPTSGRESPRQDNDLRATIERISSLQLSSVSQELEAVEGDD